MLQVRCNGRLPYSQEDVEGILGDFVMELQKACSKHPMWPGDMIHGAAIVAEEAGELIRATLQKKYEGENNDNELTEGLHTGAMALRFLLEQL